MKNLKFILIVILSGTGIYANAQQDPHFTQYFDNTLFYNPAYAGSRDMLNVTAIHREQWAGVDGRPRSTTLSIHSPLPYESVGVGITAVNDMAGPIRQTIIAADISYSLRFKNKTKLSFGVKAGVNLLGFDRDKLYNAGNPVSAMQQIENRANPNIGFGVLYHGPKFFFGVSTPKLIQNTYDGTDFNKEKRHYFATLGYIFKLHEKWKLRPSAQFKITEGAPFSMDASLAAIYNDRLWFGALYRLDAALGAFVQVQISPQFKLGIASDFGTQKLRQYNSGTFEVLLSYDFNFLKKGVYSPRYF
ncbi:type IX secretion system membrane protein PorP/SprF [Crocinitomicaceae bacterium CZZ-1]|uniref:Type IX secretion system membrane protein PorP/SprF n=1 Tax=Taishania pollutisoli TaxID=2766479 RepID=A0A8J6P9S9_9FLAO|nr:type IX secretion system membrane protein PorP/SprF [Taishania pollutisoli]MBC9811263.1 type IX secretion system membrane protein PorP/SprF [Taishania pollutisoli]MBX2947822.1 type IX secretion system membrane protein PorP/SprF [Crocinitomicaceae bacterium]